MNNFETITVDISRCLRNGTTRFQSRGLGEVLSFLVGASIPGIRKIDVVMRLDQVDRIMRNDDHENGPRHTSPQGYTSYVDVDGNRVFTWAKTNGRAIRGIRSYAQFLGDDHPCILV